MLILALLLLNRLEEARLWITKSLSREPNAGPTLRFATVIYAMLGDIEKAQEIYARLEQAGGGMLISEQKNRSPLQPKDAELFIRGLRLAGVPE